MWEPMGTPAINRPFFWGTTLIILPNLKRSLVIIRNLVGGFKHFLFSIIYGMSSFPLTNSYFSRWLKPPPVIVSYVLQLSLWTYDIIPSLSPLNPPIGWIPTPSWWRGCGVKWRTSAPSVRQAARVRRAATDVVAMFWWQRHCCDCLRIHTEMLFNWLVARLAGSLVGWLAGCGCGCCCCRCRCGRRRRRRRRRRGCCCCCGRLQPKASQRCVARSGLSNAFGILRCAMVKPCFWARWSSIHFLGNL